MKKIQILFVAIISLSQAVLAQSVTMNIPKDPIGIAEDIIAPVYEIKSPETTDLHRRFHMMTPLDSIFIEVVLPPGAYAAIYVDVTAESIAYCNPPELPLDSAMKYWVEHSPYGLKLQLEQNLAALNPSYYSIYDDLLRSADPLWRDEILYCLAHLAREILELPEMSFLLDENVRGIYAMDSLLSYVEIIDLGTPGGGDHRTEAHYLTIDTGMVGYETIVLDSEMYYRYVMFPKITDEIPGYIEPHTGDRIDPWYGCFWRTWFWDIEETIGGTYYWPLGDSLCRVSTLWSGIFNNAADNGAVGVVTSWIQNSLDFDSDAERPHQPVRIYAKHKGRCGEHEDITVAAARTALLPARGIESISTDHVWNEFWTGWRWAGWEPVNNYVDHQWVYADGWGKEFATVYEHTGKGRMEPVTRRYSHEIAEINITATDAVGRPVDGAKLMIAAESGTSIYYDCILFTNSRGKAKAVVGDNKHMYYRVDSEIGCNPEPGFVSNLVTNTMDGIVYSRTASIPGNMPYHTYSLADSTDSPTAYLGARVRPVGEFIEYAAPFDDILATYYHWEDDAYGYALFALTEDQFPIFESGGDFAALIMHERCDFASFEIPVENSGYWIVLSNRENVKNTLVGELAVMLHRTSSGIPSTEMPVNISLGAYPNPFNSAVKIVIEGGRI